MGRPSDKRRSARRPGKLERIRVKNRRRGGYFTHAPGAESSGIVKAGRKKLGRHLRWVVRQFFTKKRYGVQ